MPGIEAGSNIEMVADGSALNCGFSFAISANALWSGGRWLQGFRITSISA